MNSPDIRTLIFSFFITDLIISIVIAKLWLDNRKHFSGTFFWVMNFVFQTIALLLIGLRGTIPDWSSMVVSNALVISGNMLGLIGLKRFSGNKSSDIQNYIFLVLFVIIHSWFALVKPDLPVRNLNLASAFLIISFQFCWLVFYRLKGEMHKLTRNIGIIFILYSLVNIGRIVNFFTAPHHGNDYFKPNGFESSVLIIYQMLFILLTYTLALMFNKRLMYNIDKGAESLKESQALLQAAMDCSPSGIAIADAPDGKLRYVNKAGLMIPAKSEDEIVKDIDINKYVASWHIKHHDGTPYKPDEVPLARAVLYGETNSREFIISRENDENRVVLANAAPILDDYGNVKAGIVVFQDITDYKRTDSLLNEKIKELEDARITSLKLIENLNLEVERRRDAERGIRKTEKYFRFLIENAPDGVVLVNSEGKMTYASPAARSIFGYDDDFLELPDPNESTHPDDLPMVLETIKDLIQDPVRLKTIKYRFRKSDGNWLWVESTFANHFTDEGIEALVINFRDITASKTAEDLLIASEEKFRNLFEHSPVGKSITGIDGTINVNKAFCNILGYTEVELKAKNWKDISHPEDISATDKYVKSLISGKSDSARFEKRYLHKNGGTVFTDVTTYLQRDDNGTPQYFITTISDITNRKMAEIMLREEKERIRTILDLVGDPIFVKDNDHRILLANRAFYDIFNMDENSVIGYTLVEAVPENERHHFLEVDRRVLDTGISDLQEEELTVGGLNRTIITRKTRFVDESGNKFLVGSIHDITNSKLAESKLRASQERFSLVISASEQGIWDWNIETNDVFYSEQWKKQIGYEDHEIENNFNSWIDHLHPDEKESCQLAVQSYLDNPVKHFILEFRFRHKDGSYRMIHNKSASVKSAEGKVLRMFGTHTDITERKQAEEEIRKLNETLEQRVIDRTDQLRAANSELEAFSYSVSHDLRAPLRAIHSFTSILKEDYKDKLDDEGKRVCGIIESSSVHMGQLIDDLLAFSRISRTEIRHSKIDMTRMVESILDELLSVEERKRLKLNIKKLPVSYGDSSTIRQVLVNLILNAIKYSSKNETPEIIIGCEKNNNVNTYYVRDNGVGFDMQYSDKLFRVFQRLHSTKEFDGNGVGLAIVHRIITRHGGKVWAEGEVGKGATFYFTLPDKDKR